MQEQCLCKAETEQVGGKGSLRMCTGEVPGSNVVPDTDYPCMFSVHTCNARIVP
jgi:hypothetical protein